jgi:RimJ/RimL family protein N-acetyltransferase
LSAQSPLLIPLPEALHGPRVTVRPYNPDDAPAMWEAVEESRDHLWPWLPWVDHYRSPDDARAYMVRARAHWMLREDLPVGVWEREGGRLLGGSGLHRFDWELRSFEIGYWLRRSAEGRGYMTEAVRLLTGLAFDTLLANRVEIRMDPRNTRSRAVPERLGFVLEGTLRSSMLDAEGRPRDQRVYSLLPDEYRRLPWAGSVEG